MQKDIDEFKRDYYEIRRKSSELSQKFEAFKNGANKIGTLKVYMKWKLSFSYLKELLKW